MIEYSVTREQPAAIRRREAKAAYQREYNRTERGKDVRRAYRHRESKWVTDAEYLSRRIVAIDGEGVNRPNGDHDYLLLAISGVPPISSDTRLSTMGILEYVWRNVESEDLAVIYGGSYDFNQWCKDLGEESLRRLYRAGRTVYYGPYAIRWQPGKQFTIKRDGKTVTVNDVISFFQAPFVQACDLYLGASDTWTNARETIVREKARRGVFDPSEIANISDYNQLELDCLTELVRELRARFNKVHLRPRRWNSPGAVAAALFMREGIKAHRDTEIPERVADASRRAYFGGRFEVIKYGIVPKPAYEYDINSAYPAALTEVPSLAGGTWETVSGDAGPQAFALYHVRFENTDPDAIVIPGPVPTRCENGTICYPMKADGWIWSPEMDTLRRYCETIPGARYEVVQTHVFEPATPTKPFAFVAALYRMRQALKKAKDGAHLAIKLALNSLYGKTAQQVGWKPATATRPVRIPPYHQLEWAGYVTSHCRSKVLAAALENIGSVIAFETDALFTDAPLVGIAIGNGLGDWEATAFESLTYIQSGHYYGTQDDGTEVAKYRGVDRGTLNRAEVERAMRRRPPNNTYRTTLTRFMGAGIALARGIHHWNRWETEDKVLTLQPSGKRRHAACWCTAERLTPGRWHLTECPVPAVVSSPYPVAWINPDPMMTELEEMREREVDYETA